MRSVHAGIARLAAVALASLVALAQAAEQGAAIASVPLVAPFSAASAGASRPRGWEAIRLSERKALTRYDLVNDAGTTVLRARADAAASLLAHRTTFDISAAPIAQWRWKIDQLIPGADGRQAGRDDSPVRVIFAFDGDKSRLSMKDRAVFMITRATGNELPYATLMYVWSNDLPVGSVLPNPHTRRVQMVVAASGARDVGEWRRVRRNVLEDFRRAFGEEPGRLVAIAVMTDTDNTGQSIESWYGDIALQLAEN